MYYMKARIEFKIGQFDRSTYTIIKTLKEQDKGPKLRSIPRRFASPNTWFILRKQSELHQGVLDENHLEAVDRITASV